MQRMLHCIVFTLICFASNGQKDSSVLILHPQHIFTDSLEKVVSSNGYQVESLYWNELKDSTTFESYSQLWIFSSGSNNLSTTNLNIIQEYIGSGKGVYLGAENEPFWEEANMIAESIWNTSFYGNQIGENTTLNKDRSVKTVETASVLDVAETDFYQGNTVAVFPLHPSFTVLSWVNDEPLLLHTREENQNVIIDGGYSRFFVGREEELITILLEVLE